MNIASTEALGATPLDSAYVAVKAGVTGLTRALAVDLGKEQLGTDDGHREHFTDARAGVSGEETVRR